MAQAPDEGMTDSPLFTQDDIETLDLMIADYGFGVPWGSSIRLETLRDRIQQWIDQEANTTRITPHPDWAKVRLPPIDETDLSEG